MPRLLSVRSFRRALVGVAALGAITALPLPAHADTGTAMSVANGMFTGTDGNDTLVFGVAPDGNLTNNRFALGDPGFESPEDFNSTVAGVQTRLASKNQVISVNLLGGDDTLKFTGHLAPAVVNGLDMGTGRDVIDASGMTAPFAVGYANQAMQNVEVVIGSPYDDTIYGSGLTARDLPYSVWGMGGNDIITGTNGPDRIDGGGGNDQITAFDGDDIITVTFPLPTQDIAVDAGNGNDFFAVNGTTHADDVVLTGVPGDFSTWDGRTTTGDFHVTGAETARINLGAGDDSAYVSTLMPQLTVTGGPGHDTAVVDALGSTATVESTATSTGTARKVTVPVPYGNTPLAPGVVKLDPAVELLGLGNETTIATAPGPGAGPHVRTFRADGTPLASFFAYDPAFTGGVNVAMGDVNGDGDDDIITTPGPGGGGVVRVFAADGSDTGASFAVNGAGFAGGISVAAIDTDGDGVDEIVTAVSTNADVPWVRIWNIDGVLLGQWPASGFGTTGIKVARGPMFDDGSEGILVSAAAGSPSLVKLFDATGAVAPFDYAPFGSFSGGASVSRGMFANTGTAPQYDAWDEIVTGAGPGGSPLVRVAQQSADGTKMTPLSAFYAYTSTFTGGVDVANCNADGGPDEIVTAPGAGAAPLIRTFGLDGSTKRKSFLAYDSTMTAGVHVVCGATMSRVFGS